MIDARLAALHAMLHRQVPLSRHMGVAVDGYESGVLTLSAELQPNINVHGTAFGGSLYALAALGGWCLLRLRLQDLGLEGGIVLGSARIDYREPLRTRLLARASCAAADLDAFAARLRSGGRARITVSVALGGLSEQGWREAAVFNGVYATA